MASYNRRSLYNHHFLKTSYKKYTFQPLLKQFKRGLFFVLQHKHGSFLEVFCFFAKDPMDFSWSDIMTFYLNVLNLNY